MAVVISSIVAEDLLSIVNKSIASLQVVDEADADEAALLQMLKNDLTRGIENDKNVHVIEWQPIVFDEEQDAFLYPIDLQNGDVLFVAKNGEVCVDTFDADEGFLDSNEWEDVAFVAQFPKPPEIPRKHSERVSGKRIDSAVAQKIESHFTRVL